MKPALWQASMAALCRPVAAPAPYMTKDSAARSPSRSGPLPGQGVAAGQGDDEFVALQRNQRSGRGVQQRRAHQSDVQPVVFQLLQDGYRGRLVQHQLHAGILAVESRHHLLQHAVGRGADKADLQSADGALERAARDGAELGAVEQQLARFDQHRAAGGRQRHALCAAFEQLGAELRLQLLDGNRQRRLRHVQPFSRAAEVQGFGKDDEVTDPAQVHGAGCRVAAKHTQRSVGPVRALACAHRLQPRNTGWRFSRNAATASR